MIASFVKDKKSVLTILFIIGWTFSSFATCPKLTGVNNFDTIGISDEDPAGNTVEDIIQGKVTVPNNSKTIDNFEDSNDQTIWGGFWYTYPDSVGNSEVNAFSVTDDGINSTKGVKLNYTLGDSLGSGDGRYGPYVALGVSVKEVLDPPQSAMDSIRDLTYVDKFKYWYKGPAHEFVVDLSYIFSAEDYRQQIVASTDWKLAEIDFDSSTVFKQPNWVVNKSPFRKDSVVAFTWNIPGPVDASGTFSLDSFTVDANFPDPGIAVINTDTNSAGGKWQYKTGSSWEDFSSSVSNTKAVLLNDNAIIRFKPDNTDGGAPYLRIRAWDQSESRPNGSTDVNTYPADITDQTPFSEETLKVEIVIGEPPEVTKDPDDITVSEGQDAAFDIEATGTEPLTYQWQKKKDGDWEDIDDTDSNYYSFKAELQDDSWKFQCVVSNGFGKDTSKAATLTVEDAGDTAKITEDPKDLTVTDGETAAFDVEATGAVPLEYQWQRKENNDWEDIDDTNSDSYSFTANLNDDGVKFHCIVSNNLGKDTSKAATLTVEEEGDTAKITKDPDDLTVTEGNTATFDVRATGAGELTYQWQKKKDDEWKDIADTDSNYYSFETKLEDDSLKFRCIVSNDLGKDNSKSATLTVKKSVEYPSPFRIYAEKPDTNDPFQIRLTISAIEDITDFQTEPTAEEPWAEHVWVLYQTKDYPGDTSDVVAIRKFDIEEIKESNNDTIVKDIKVKTLPQDNDSCYYFSNTILWHDSSAKDAFVPLIDANRVIILSGENDSSLKIPNVIEIKTADFDSSINSILVEWSVDLSIKPPGAVLEWNYAFSIKPDKSYKKEESLDFSKWIEIDSAENNFSFPLGRDIVFDTTYYIGMWLRAVRGDSTGPAAKPVDKSIDSIETPTFTWEPVFIFPDVVKEDDAANGMIFMKEIVGEEGSRQPDTVRAFDLPIPDGFEDAGGVAFKFDASSDVRDFRLGLRFTVTDSIEKVGLYQYIDSGIYVVDGFEIENDIVWARITMDDMAYPFLVLSDMQLPKITITEYEEKVEQAKSVNTGFKIEDNVVNVKWHLAYSAGAGAYEDTIIGEWNSSIEEDSALMTNSTSVNSGTGLRALLTINDGVYSITENISRKVITSDSVYFGELPEKEWEPLHASVELDEPQIEKIFGRVLDSGTQWKYDTHKYRLFRYNSESGENDKWLEYSDNDKVKDDFDLIPGKLVWCKAAKKQSFFFGKGVTVSLKENCLINLRKKGCTDLTLPFNFAVVLEDIFRATGKDSTELDVYKWEKKGKIYEPKDIFVSGLDRLEEADDEIRPHIAYTFYNNTSSNVELNIPPIPPVLSESLKRKEKPKEKTEEIWDVRFMWKISDKGKESSFSRLRCGFNNSIKSGRYGHIPSHFSTLNVGIIDTANNTLHPYCIKNNLKHGGLTYEIFLDNKSENNMTISYRLDNLKIIPKNFSVRILNPATCKYEENKPEDISQVHLEKQSSSSRFVVIGSGDYFDKVKGMLAPLKFNFVKAFPNPFINSIRIQYTVPKGISAINFTLFNLAGQRIWAYNKNHNVKPGRYVFLMNGKNSGRNGVKILPTGVYIVRLTAKNKSGKIIFNGEKRLMCVK